MEAGGLNVGHIFADLDARLDEKNFKRFDQAVDRSKSKAREMSREQDRLGKSTDTLTRAQMMQAKVLRSQGHDWASVAQQVGVSEDQLRSYNTTVRTTVREHEKVKKSTRDTSREFIGMDGAVSRVNRAATFFSRTLRLLKWPALITAVGSASQGILALTGGVVGLTSALSPLSGLLATIPAALGSFLQGLGTAALGLMGVKNAVKALNDQQIKSGATAEDQAKKQRTAATQIRGAEEQLASAQRSTKDSQKSLTEARREAVRSLVDMRNAAAQASLGEKGAQLALRRSIVELAQAQADPSSSMLDIQELELRVDESRQSLKEARLENNRAKAESKLGQKRGVRKDPGVVAAIRDRADAKRGEAKAERDVAESRRDANEALEETSTAATKVEQSFASLNPQAAKFARFLFGLKPQLKELQQASSKGLLPGLESGIGSAMKNLPIVKRIIGGTSQVLGNLAERAGKLFGSKGFGKELEIVGRGNARTIGQMGTAGLHLLKALTGIQVAAQPFLKWMGKYTNGLARWIEKSVEVNRKNGDLAKFFGKTRGVVERLTSIFQSLGATLHVIGEESAPLGREILKSFDDGAQGLEKWSESVGGRNSIAKFFQDARGPLWEAGRLVRDIVKDFFSLGDGEGMESIEHLLHQLRVELLPVFTEVTQQTTKSFGPHLVELLTAVLGLFGRLSGSSGPLTFYVDTLTAAATITNTLLDTVPGLRGIVVNLLGLAAVMKTVATIGKFTGITKGLELVFGPELGGKLRAKFIAMMKEVFVRAALGANLAATWGAETAGDAAKGFQRQLGKFKAVARRAAIAFIGVFAPEVAAGMAAGGRLGEVLSARFPKLAAMFKRGGKMSGRAFVVGAVLGLALIGFEVGKLLAEKVPDQAALAMREAAEHAAEVFVNTLVKSINAWMDRSNVLGNLPFGLGVDAPNIPEARFNAVQQAKREAAETPEGQKGRAEARRRTPKKRRRHERQEGRHAAAAMTTREHREAYEDLWGQPPPPGPPPWPMPSEIEERVHGARGRAEGGRNELMGGGVRRKRPEDEAKDQRKKVTDEHRKMRRDVDDETARMQRNASDRFGKIRKGATDETKRMDKAVTGNVSDMAGAHDRSTRAMLTATDSRFDGMRQIVAQRSGRMNEDLSANVGEMNATTTEGMQRIQGAVVKALKAFGVKNVDLSLTGDGVKSPKGRPAKAARGAVFTVPGEGLQDSVYLPGVNAMVAPGENLFAATRHQQPLLDLAVANTFGVGGLDDFFATFNRPHHLSRGGQAPKYYAGGGMIDPSWDPGTEVIARSIEPQVHQWAKRYKADITAGYDPGGGHISPGHNVTGTATDVVPAAGWTGPATKLFEAGLHYLVGKGFEVLYDGHAGTVPYPNHGRGNHAHIEWVGNGTVPDAIASLGGMGGLQKIKEILVGGTPGTERSLAQLALNRTIVGANHYLGKKTGGLRGPFGDLSFGPGALSKAEFLKVAREALRITGHAKLPGGALKLLKLAMQESTLNPNAINLTDSNAAAGIPSQGLMQVIPPTFNTYHEPGTSHNIKDPLANIAASINYQYARYGGLVTSSPYARGGRIRFATGGGMTGISKARALYGLGPSHAAIKKKPKPVGIGNNYFGGEPTGKYSPAALLQMAESTGISLPYALLDNGVPNWRKLPVAKYAELVNEYLRSIGEYRSNLGEELKASQESFPANPLLTSVAALSANTIGEAIGYHPPISGDIGAYQQGYGTLGRLDATAEDVRGQLFGTYTESYLAPYEARRSQITTTRDRILASLHPEKEAKKFAQAKLKGLKGRIHKAQKTRLKGVPKNKKAKAAQQVKQRINRKTAHQIKKHTAMVKRRADKRRKGAEANYEEHIEEGILDPVEAQREEIEKRYQYESARREELAPLLSEIALNAQRTALVGRSQSGLFARGGRVSAGAVSPVVAQAAGAPSVVVPVAVRLSGSMEALNPHIAMEVDGAVRNLGQAAGVRRATVSAPGRRVSYGGK